MPIVHSLAGSEGERQIIVVRRTLRLPEVKDKNESNREKVVPIIYREGCRAEGI